MTGKHPTPPHVIHIVTVAEHDRNQYHATQINEALAEWSDGWRIELQHSVSCIDSVFSGDSTSTFNGTGWVYSTLILVSRW